MPVIEAAIVALFVGFAGVAAWCDLSTLRIPNRLSLAIVLLFPAHLAASGSVTEAVPAMAVAAAVFLGGWALFSFRLIGGGDVKLAAAVALWAGPPLVGQFLMLTLLLGGGLALLMIGGARHVVAYACDVVGAFTIRDVLLGRSIPYGVAIAGAGVLTVGVPLAARLGVIGS
jgi:prepilin peptidase CpaA